MTGDASSVRSRLGRAQVSPDGKRSGKTRGERSRTPKPLSSAHSLSTERAGGRPPSPQLRRALSDRRELMAAARVRAQSPLMSARHLVSSSIGKLIAMALILAAACFLAGWYASLTLNSRTQILQDTVNHTEPLSESSQVLYSSLSIADAAANAAFISGGLEPPTLRKRYSDAIATASNALIIAASNSTGVTPTGNDDIPVDPVHTDLAVLATNVPVYTGIIETARTNNRLGNPVGSAYLGEASSLMQDTILPAAQRLYERRSAAIADPQRSLTQPPWAVYAVLALVLIALIFAARYLSRHTRRRFNIGILIATIAIVVGLTWLLVAGLMSVAATNDAKNNGADPLRELTQARIETQQARSAQTLSLVRRDQDSLEETYRKASDSIARTLTALKDERQNGAATSVSDELIQRAINAHNGWDQANSEINRLVAGGDFRGARSLLVGDTANSAARFYSELDMALVEAITSARTVFRDDINTAQRVMGFSGNGIWTLGIIAAVAIPIGLAPRVREYM
ncbi:hypothetical protein [Gordonia sp. CPCC 205333]|uniref:hypothetical protein n=1 Tax=Gordonia sp. CPCC 205333 TaxID=3140790 RepID=UPI003AF38F63